MKIGACEHIYVYYQMQWKIHMCLAYNLLRKGYYQAARGIWHPENNLFDLAE